MIVNELLILNRESKLLPIIVARLQWITIFYLDFEI